jgi:hypothetical protein
MRFGFQVLLGVTFQHQAPECRPILRRYQHQALPHGEPLAV